jgi:hypothetical protein
VAFAMCATFATAAPSDLPRSEEELVAAIRAAIETGDFPAFERLVLWTDISAYKRRVVSAQIRHSLGRPIQKIEVEEADEETRRGLQNIRNLRLNLPVLDLLRVTYGDGADEPVTPTAVFLIGKLDGAYRIALLVRKTTVEDND